MEFKKKEKAGTKIKVKTENANGIGGDEMIEIDLGQVGEISDTDSIGGMDIA